MEDIVTGLCLHEDRIISLSLDRRVEAHLLLYPDITEDFDAAVQVRHLPDFTKSVPADEDFLLSENYSQDLRTYRKQCRCLAIRKALLDTLRPQDISPIKHLRN